MFSKLIWLLNLLALSTTSLLEIEKVGFTVSNFEGTTTMISRLVKESKRKTVLFLNLNSDTLDHFVKWNDLPITVEVNDLKTNSNLKNRKIGATILHLGNLVEFENFFYLIRSEIFLYDGHFIILYGGGDVQEIEKILSMFWKAYIYNVSVLFTDPISTNSVAVLTYMPFANESCNSTNPIRINEFNKTTMKWTTNTFFPKKFKQLNRCSVRYGLFQIRPGVIIDNDDGVSGSQKFSGINVDVWLMFSYALNFTLNFVKSENVMGVVYKNRTATALFKRVMDSEIDFVFASLQQDRAEALSATRTLFLDKVILIVPPPYETDPMNKIFRPFTLVSWIFIGMMVVLACCIVKVMKFTPKVVHDYIIGSNVQGNMFNVCNVFLGGTLPILPRSNFPRFLLAKFWIFTLVIRSLYQGQVFKTLKMDEGTVELNTIDEFIEHKFTFYIFETLAARLQGSKIMERHEVISNSALGSYSAKTLNPSFKGVVFGYLSYTLYDNLINRKNYTFRICREVLHTNSYVFYFRKNFYLVREINQLIQRFESAGLLDFVVSKYIDPNDLMKTMPSKPPSAINYANIEGVFIIFYYGCVFALVTFICEIIIAWI